MLPNLHKIAGELTPCAIHVAARSVAAQALSIFGDHSDVMAACGTGFGLLCSASVQEAQDMAAIATAASFASRIPFIHFFDGFRTSHEIQKIELLSTEQLPDLMDDEAIAQHRQRSLSPDRRVIRGTAQNPDVFFQAREAINPYYQKGADIVEQTMNKFAQLTGRQYRPFEYYGSPTAERIIVLMGSGCETVQETVAALNRSGENIGVVKVRLYRSFDAKRLVAAIPKTVKAISVLDRTKEPGGSGEPLYLDVLTALLEQRFTTPNNSFPRVVGGRYGLSSKEFTPDTYAQGYFVYDSKKSGSVTISHLCFGPQPIHAPYLITQASFVACHQWPLLDQIDVLAPAAQGSTLLLNSPYTPEETWRRLPERTQAQIIQKQLNVFAINAYQVARAAGMGGRINTVMQTSFFVLADVLPQQEAIAAIKAAILKTYQHKGDAIVAMNLQAVDQTLQNLYAIPVPESAEADTLPPMKPAVASNAPPFVQSVLGKMMQRQGDSLPVSALPCDGTYPTGTAQWEKRNIAQAIPVWDPDVCVQCAKCVMVCPHSAIRGKAYDPEHLKQAPETFLYTDAREWKGQVFTLQVAAEDCTGCGICVDVCPAKNKAIPRLKAINMTPVYQPSEPSAEESQTLVDLRQQEKPNWDFFLNLPSPDRQQLNLHRISQQQMQKPLFEFSGACAGCGKRPT